MAENQVSYSFFTLLFASSFIRLQFYRDFYGFNESFDHTLLFSRRKDDLKRNIYFTTPEIKDIVNLNFDRLTVKNNIIILVDLRLFHYTVLCRLSIQELK